MKSFGTICRLAVLFLISLSNVPASRAGSFRFGCSLLILAALLAFPCSVDGGVERIAPHAVEHIVLVFTSFA
jgi:hypothetical protein